MYAQHWLLIGLPEQFVPSKVHKLPDKLYLIIWIYLDWKVRGTQQL